MEINVIIFIVHIFLYNSSCLWYADLQLLKLFLNTQHNSCIETLVVSPWILSISSCSVDFVTFSLPLLIPWIMMSWLIELNGQNLFPENMGPKILVIPSFIILAVHIHTACKPCFIKEKNKFPYLIFVHYGTHDSVFFH